jgi:outer membrane protein assembly factor BamE (lipoprotein component of BamABCDE complex)
MRKSFFLIILILSLVSCSTTLITTGTISDQNRINISSLQVGMTQDQVVGVMGYPYKAEQKSYNGMEYEVWYYITEPSILGQTRLVTRNFTPLVFEEGLLKGWGRNFYKFTFNIDNEKWKREMEQKQKYTNDKEEWPRNEHIMILPMNEEPSSEQQSDKINETILELEKSSETQEKPVQSEVEEQTIKPSDNASKDQTPLIPKEPSSSKKQNVKSTENKESEKTPDIRCKPTDEKEQYIFWE